MSDYFHNHHFHSDIDLWNKINLIYPDGSVYARNSIYTEFAGTDWTDKELEESICWRKREYEQSAQRYSTGGTR